jgi:metallo-beta-lactamase family protein
MEITHHGGHTGVTGSCHRAQLDASRALLIDCGTFQGKDAKQRDDLEIEFPVDDVQALILTHVHIDHVGRIPYLLGTNFKGPIYCSRPTAKLLPKMLEDAIRLKITRKNRLVQAFLKEIHDRLRPVPYGKWEELDGGGKIRFQPAGHVLGSAYVEIDHDDHRVVFSGDLGSRKTPLLKEPVSPERADLLILESTYGNRNHEGRDERVATLEKILCRTLANKGVTIIPAFSLGRTQEILYEMNKIFEEIGHKQQCSLLKRVDVIIDSPLASRLTKIYEEMREFWDEEAHLILEVDDEPLVFENLLNIGNHSEHRDTIDYLKSSDLPAVVIAGSGMCTGGRVVNYLKAFIEDERTDVVFAGYQAFGTPGRFIQNKEESEWVRLDGKPYTINAEVHTLTGYSAHADQSDLIRFVEGIPAAPQEIRLVHGEDHAKDVLDSELSKRGFHVTDGAHYGYPT